MTRNAVILIFACALAGALFHIWKSGIDSQAEKFEVALKANLPQKRKVGICVFALRNINYGDTITADAIEERELDERGVPAGAVLTNSAALGRKSEGISKGEIVLVNKLYPVPPGYMRQAVRAEMDIPKGTVIKADAVEEYSTLKDDMPAGMLRSSSMAIGKKAKDGILKHQILGEDHIEP